MALGEFTGKGCWPATTVAPKESANKILANFIARVCIVFLESILSCDPCDRLASGSQARTRAATNGYNLAA